MPKQIDQDKVREMAELCSKSLEELEKAEQIVTKVMELKDQSSTKGAVGSFEDKIKAEKRNQLMDVRKILVNAITNVKGLVNVIKNVLGLKQDVSYRAPGLGMGGTSQPSFEEDDDEASK